jgi:hypothetical protein
MDNVKRYSSFIKRILTAPDPIRKHLLKTSNLNIIKAISEIILNVVEKNITLSTTALKKLKKHKKVIYSIVDSKGFETRRHILVKNSQLLPILIPLFK